MKLQAAGELLADANATVAVAVFVEPRREDADPELTRQRK
jgi:hypothetical protein